jgi:hypothetical protein
VKRLEISQKEKVELTQDALKHWKRNGLKNLTVQEMINFNNWAEERERELQAEKKAMAATTAI